MKKRRFHSIAMLLAMLLVMTPFQSVHATSKEGENTSDVTNITIVHTNDIHGRNSYSQKGKVYGFEKLKGLMETMENAILLDAGDTFHGQAFATLEQGASIAKLMQEVGYDAMTPGNHDWNYGKDRLKELQTISNVPILANNVKDQNNSFFDNDGTIIKEIEGIKVGILGVFDQDIKSDTAPRNIEGLTFHHDADVANELATSLKESKGCDIVVALTHQLDIGGFVGQIKNVDLVVAGHEHALWNEEYLDANHQKVKVVEAGKYFENVGIVNIEVDSTTNKILSIEEQFHTWQEAGEVVSNGEVVSLLEKINTSQNNILNEKIGSMSVELDGRWEELRIMETTLGRIIGASYIQETGADIAFENAGGIRLGKKLPAGDIIYQNIIDIAPFGNYIVTKKLSGKEIIDVLERSIDIGIQNKKSYDEWKQTGSDKIPWPDNSGDYLQFSGLSVTYDEDKPMGQRVQTIKVKDEVLDRNKLYTVATNNFVAQGGGYTALANYPELNQYSACDEALVRFVKNGQEIVDKVALVENVSVVLPANDKVIPNTKDENQWVMPSLMLSLTGSLLLFKIAYKKTKYV